MDQIIFFILIIEVIVLAKIDRILYGTFLTPVTLISIPFIFILLFIVTIGPSMGFLDFYYPSLWVWIIGLFVFWLPSSILAFLFLENTNIYNYPYIEKVDFKLDKFIYFFSYILIAILILGLIQSLKSGNIGSEEFEDNFGSGIVAHVSIISRFFFIYLIVRYNRKNLLPIVFFLIVYLAYGAKSWILIPVIAAILIRIILGKTKFSIVLLLKITLLGMLVFYLTYLIVIGPEMPFDFIFIHFFKYLFSGILSLSEYIRLEERVGIDPLMLINPIVNTYNKIIGNKTLDTFSDVLTYIGNDADINVKTFFGTIYLYAGLGWGVVFTFLVGCYYYCFLLITIKTKNLILLIVYFTILTLLLFGWFDIYSSNLFFYEFPVFGILLYLFNLPKSK